MNNKSIVIVGAGISGLTIGYELVKKGFKVVVVEKENTVGGLAKSFKYDSCTFDIGPHRFFTSVSWITRFIKRILRDDIVTIPRDSKVYFKGKYHQWPLRPNIFFNLPLSFQVKTVRDLIFKIFKKNKNASNFQEGVLNNYGPTIYKSFFREYTKKFMGISPNMLDVDWANTGMAMAIIDKQLPHTHLWDLFRLSIKPQLSPTLFLYPKGGIGSFCDYLMEGILKEGGIILTGENIKNITCKNEKIQSLSTNNETLECDKLIWTGSINDITRLLNFSETNLKYLSLISYNIVLNNRTRDFFQWCYFGEKDIIFNRVTNPVMFDESLVPKNKSGLCVEVTCKENDEVWNHPDKLVDRIKQDLIKVGLIGKREDIDFTNIERVLNAYPIYDLGYSHRLRKVKNDLGIYKNLILAGRTGLFWYKNMDECISNSFNIIRKCL